jgi:hypothetical protein
VLVADEGQASLVVIDAVVSSAVTVYPVMDPALMVGAVQVTAADVTPPTAVAFVGAPGRRLFGVTDVEDVENDPVPTALRAATLKVYASPLVSPVTEHLVVVLDVEEGHASVVGVEVVVFSADTVYPVIALPPVLVGAVQLTVADALPLAGAPMVGVPGVVAGVTLAEELENDPVPPTLMAATVKVYASPLVSPVTMQVAAVLDVEEGHASVVGVTVVVFSAVTV